MSKLAKKNGEHGGLEVADVTQYAALTMNADELTSIVAENVGMGGLTQFDLTRVKIPAGGGVAWEVPTLGGSVSMKAIEGVIISHRMTRSYWESDYSGDKQPPDCSSEDGVIGSGSPGGECATCPLSQWVSDPKGGPGQACQQRRLLFVVLPDDLLPTVISVPPTSLKAMGQWMLGLANKRLPFYGVVCRLELAKAKSSKGIEYSAIVPSVVGILGADDMAKFKALGDGLKPAMRALIVAREG